MMLCLLNYLYDNLPLSAESCFINFQSSSCKFKCKIASKNESVKYVRKQNSQVSRVHIPKTKLIFVYCDTHKIKYKRFFPTKNCLRWIYERSNLIFFLSFSLLHIVAETRKSFAIQSHNSKIVFCVFRVYVEKSFEHGNIPRKKLIFHRVVSCFMQICESICNDISHSEHCYDSRHDIVIRSRFAFT